MPKPHFANAISKAIDCAAEQHIVAHLTILMTEKSISDSGQIAANMHINILIILRIY